MRSVLGLTYLLVFTSSVWAQSERGNITGIVSDPSGAAVAGASLTITQRATNASVTLTTSAACE